MIPIKFQTELINKFPKFFDYLEQNIVISWIQYIIDSDKRKAVILSDWIREQVKNPSAALKRIADEEIGTTTDYDFQVKLVLDYVKNNLRYVGDNTQWKTPEVWTPANDTATSLLGDCEDGSTLAYVLCRLKGVPANRLLIWAGNVAVSETAPTAGHCALFYKPLNYPFNFVSLDWCYYPNDKLVTDRNVFQFYDKSIEEWKQGVDGLSKVESKYKSSWFLFNENVSYSNYLPKGV